MYDEHSRQWLVKRRDNIGENNIDNTMKSSIISLSTLTLTPQSTSTSTSATTTMSLQNTQTLIMAQHHQGKVLRRTINKALLTRSSSWSWPQLARVKLCPNQIVEVLLALVLVNYVATLVTSTSMFVAADVAGSTPDDSSSYGLYRNPNRMGYFGYKIDADMQANENHLQRNQNFKITPKPCSFGHIEGTCMFVWECIKSEGRHVGMCVDSFMFGSCCSHNFTDNIVLPPTMFAYTRPSKPTMQGNFNSNFSQRPRPPHIPSISGMTTIERPHGAGTLVIRPSGPHHQGALHRPLNTKQPPTSTTQRTTTTTTVNGGLGSTTNQLNAAHWSSNVVIEDQHLSASAVPTSPLNTIWHSSLTSLSPAGTHHQHWHMTTEPNFITKPRPPSWEKPMPLRPSKPQKPTKRPIASDSQAMLTQTPSPTVHPKPSTTKPQNLLWPTTSIVPLTWISSPTSNTKPTKQSTITMRPYTRPTLSWSTAQRPTVLTSSTTPGGGVGGGGGGAPTKPVLVSTTQKYRPTSSSPVLQPQQTTNHTTQTTKPMPTPTPTPARNTTTMPVTPTMSTPTASLSATATSEASETAIETNEIIDANGAESAPTGTVKTISAARTECGMPLLARPETRIVGGKSAAFGRWPWQVSVRRTSFFGFSSTHRCGGALINENWIATAGHCVDDLLISQIRIRVGEYDFSHVQEQLPYIERGVAKKVVHPKYNFFTYEYDLALVKLEQPLEFAPHVSPICLPETDSLLIGMNATVTGWGRLSEGGTLPSVLQEVSVPIVSNDNCKSMFLRAGRQEFIPDIFLCAGYETGGQDSCQGDSGGPLQVRSQNGRFFLAGIISWGIGCAEANLPGVCTRISKFVPWILSNVR